MLTALTIERSQIGFQISVHQANCKAIDGVMSESIFPPYWHDSRGSDELVHTWFYRTPSCVRLFATANIPGRVSRGDGSRRASASTVAQRRWRTALERQERTVYKTVQVCQAHSRTFRGGAYGAICFSNTAALVIFLDAL